RHLRTRKSKARWPQLIEGNALILLLLLAIFVLGGEIYFRFLYDTTDSLEYTKVSLRWKDRYWHLNSNQIRDNVDYSFANTTGKRRITFVGDSFTAGHGVRDVEDRFANRLRRAHPEWEAHALAMPGADTGDEIKMLEEGLQRGYQLDEVVLVYCLN